MLSPLLLVTLVVALLSVTGVGVVLNSIRFLLNNPPLVAVILLAVCVLAPCNDGHACEQLDESGRLLPCYPLPHSKYVGQMCRAAERRRVLRRLWRDVEYVLGKFSNAVSTGIEGMRPWVSHLCKYLRDGTPILLSTILPVLRTAYTSTLVRRVALAVLFAGLVRYLVRYALVPEAAVLLVSVGAGWTFRAPLWEYLKSTGPDCYNQELAVQSERDARKGCLCLVKHRKQESTPTPRSQSTSIVKDRTTGSEKLRVSPVPKSDPTSTSKAREDESRALIPSPVPIRSTIDEKPKKSKRTPEPKVAAPISATGTRVSKRKVINSTSKSKPVETSAICTTISRLELPHKKTATRAPVLSEPTSGAAIAEKECGVAPTSKIVNVPRTESAISSQEPSISTNLASPPAIINDRRSEIGASQFKAVEQNMDEKKSGPSMAPSVIPEIMASEPKALDENTAGDRKLAKENIELEEKSVSTEATIASVSQANSFDSPNVSIPTAPFTLPASEDPTQTESTSSITGDVGSTEQQMHTSDEHPSQPLPLSTESVISQAAPSSAAVEDAPAATGTPAASNNSTSTSSNSHEREALAIIAPTGKSPKQVTPKRQKMLKSPSRSTSSRVLRLYAPVSRSQVKHGGRAALLKKKHVSKKAKLGRRSKRLAAAAVPPVVSTEPSMAAPVQPPPAAVSETPAPLPEGLGLAGTTAMEVCQRTAEIPTEPAAIGPVANASLDSLDQPMSPTESNPVVSLPVVEHPLPATQPISLTPMSVNPQPATPRVIAPRVPLSIPCKPVDAASFFKPYKPARVPQPGSSAAFVGSSRATAGNGTPRVVSTTPLTIPTAGDLSHFGQHTPVPPVPPAASSLFAGPLRTSAEQVSVPEPTPVKPAPALKTGPIIVHNPAEEELIAAFKKSSGQRKSSKLTETDLDYKLVIAPSTPGACRQLGRVEAQKSVAPRKNVVYSLDAQGKNRVAAGEVGKDAYVYKWNLDLGTPGVKMRAPAELWKA
ncbi:hypothetical protein FS749_003677 [Ceratobasidium sp. UAMH 11750]|nr:hypothetical protein FS749_003677 [Ceratobasidium sp. UAMH 11750]